MQGAITVAVFLQKLYKYVSEFDPHDSSFRFRNAAYAALERKILREFALDDLITQETLIGRIEVTSRMKQHIAEIFDISISEQNGAFFNELREVPGLSNAKIKRIKSLGIKSKRELLASELLNTDSRAFLTFNPLRKIPREFISNIITKMAPVFDNIVYFVVGSFRRGAPFSRDIDIIVIDTNESTKKSNTNIIDTIISRFPLVSDFARFHVYSKGPKKLSSIAEIATICEGKKRVIAVKFDVFATDAESLQFALLYATGPKESNIELRKLAKAKRLKLNQFGLFDENNQKIKREFKTEADIVKYLRET